MQITRSRRLRGAAAVVAALAALATSAVVPATSASAATTHRTVRITGGDLSWPQCPLGVGIHLGQGKGAPLPPGSFAVIGLTNGPGFIPNPCLPMHVAWAKSQHKYTAVYAMTTYPTNAQFREYGSHGPFRRNGLANVGYAEAQFNVATMRTVGLTSPIVWVDIEPDKLAQWSASPAANRAVVAGIIAGYKRAGYAVGIYSTPGLFRNILGNAHYGLPEWRTDGPSGVSGALARCSYGPSLQGGRAVLGQWWNDLYDFDVLCPAYSNRAGLTRYFHKY